MTQANEAFGQAQAEVRPKRCGWGSLRPAQRTSPEICGMAGQRWEEPRRFGLLLAACGLWLSPNLDRPGFQNLAVFQL